jgi:RNA polymerase sigma factor (sigma-70 family)
MRTGSNLMEMPPAGLHAPRTIAQGRGGGGSGREQLRASRWKPLTRTSDERLAQRAGRGDADALTAIFRRYERDLYRFCVGILGEPQDAQDAIQNTMLNMLRTLPGERREIQLKPWLYRIAHNEAVELRRRQRPAEQLHPGIADVGSSVEEYAERSERLQVLFRDIGDLPERQRAALVMRELNGLEFGEIGEVLGTSPSAVRQALYEARRGLQQMDLGRQMDCETVVRALSGQRGRSCGGRELRAHLRSCPECRHSRQARQSVAANGGSHVPNSRLAPAKSH